MTISTERTLVIICARVTVIDKETEREIAKDIAGEWKRSPGENEAGVQFLSIESEHRTDGKKGD